jgi:hypothetical protein
MRGLKVKTISVPKNVTGYSLLVKITHPILGERKQVFTISNNHKKVEDTQGTLL